MAQESSTVTMNVSLPETLKAYVDGKVASGIYGSASEFVREAIREKLAKEEALAKGWADLETRLLEALESGPGVEFKPGHFDVAKARLIQRMKAEKNRA
jgi:antitoxin ParD1/3/4